MHKADPFIPKFLDGDPKTLQGLYDKQFLGVEAYILKNGGTRDDAKEIFQNAVIVLYVKLKKEAANIQSFDNYLFSVCKNLWIKESSKKRVTELKVHTLMNEDIDLPSFHIEQQRFDLMYEYLEKLKDTCKTIVKMTLNNIPYSKIIEILGYPNENAARQKVFRCKSKLFKLIKADRRYQKLTQE